MGKDKQTFAFYINKLRKGVIKLLKQRRKNYGNFSYRRDRLYW